MHRQKKQPRHSASATAAEGDPSQNAAITPEQTLHRVAVSAALKLSTQWKLRYGKLLQQALPAVPSQKLAKLLQETAAQLLDLRTSLKSCKDEHRHDLWSALRTYKPLVKAAELLYWLQQSLTLGDDLLATVLDKDSLQPLYARLWTEGICTAFEVLETERRVFEAARDKGSSNPELAHGMETPGLMEGMSTLLHGMLDRLAAAGASIVCEPVLLILECVTSAQLSCQYRYDIGPIVTISASMHRCATMLPPYKSPRLPVASSGLDADQLARTAAAVVQAQLCIVRQGLSKYKLTSPYVYRTLVTSKATAETALQLLAAAVQCHMYEEHTQQQHQDRQQQALQQHGGAYRRSSRSSPRRAVQPHVVDIPPVLKRLKLLQPARQLYLDAVWAAVHGAGVQHLHELYITPMLQTLESRVVLLGNQHAVLPRFALDGSGQPHSPVLTTPAVLLVIEAALLISAHEHRAEPTPVQQPDSEDRKQRPAGAYADAMRLLNLQLTLLSNKGEAGFAVRRQVLLRQSGQQLLQLMRIQLQRAAAGHACVDVVAHQQHHSADVASKLLNTLLQVASSSQNNSSCDDATDVGVSSSNSKAATSNVVPSVKEMPPCEMPGRAIRARHDAGGAAVMCSIATAVAANAAAANVPPCSSSHGLRFC